MADARSAKPAVLNWIGGGGMGSQERPPVPSPAPGAPAPAGVREAVVAALAAADLDLEDVQLRRAGGRVMLRILVDTDGGVTLDAVARASTAISAALDDSGVMGERAFVLDVGSPGVDRPLTLVRHWRRNTGRLVRITGPDGSTRTGRILAVQGPADDATPTTVSVTSGGSAVEVAASAIRRAVVQVEFIDTQTLED